VTPLRRLTLAHAHPHYHFTEALAEPLHPKVAQAFLPANAQVGSLCHDAVL
jgi:hypothetical protein